MVQLQPSTEFQRVGLGEGGRAGQTSGHVGFSCCVRKRIVLGEAVQVRNQTDPGAELFRVLTALLLTSRGTVSQSLDLSMPLTSSTKGG